MSLVAWRERKVADLDEERARSSSSIGWGRTAGRGGYDDLRGEMGAHPRRVGSGDGGGGRARERGPE